MILAPFNAIRPQPQNLRSWVNRQLGDTFDENKDVLDFLSLIQPYSDKTRQIRKRLHAFLRQGVLVRDSSPSIYLLQIQTGDSKSLGFVGSVQTGRLSTGEIKAHEDVENNRVETFKEYLKITQLNAEPVVLCHPPKQRTRRYLLSIYQFTPIC